MYGSITIGEKNTYTDFGLIPTARVVVATPKVKTSYVDVSGVHGLLDLSQALTGSVLYQNCEGRWDFMAANRYQDPRTLMHEIDNYIHGKRFRIVLEDSPSYYYMGRLEVELGKLDRGFTRIGLKYNIEPFKYELNSSIEDWLWDPFNFETGIIREYKNLTVSTSLSLTIPGSSRQCIPIITCSSAMTVTFKGQSYSMSSGANRITAILIGEDDETLTFTGSGTVSVDYRGGWL